MGLPFAKLQGAGNGYIVVDGRGEERDWSALASAMAAERLGIGSDGIAVARDSQIAPIGMQIFNSDGSASEMSGNGIRLFAKFALERGLVSSGEHGVKIESGGAVKTVWPRLSNGRVVSARVAMGAPIFEPADIPVAAGPSTGPGPLIDHPLALPDRTLRVTCLSLGNPHAVAILEEPVEDFPLSEVGPFVQEHPFFPNRVNFEIVNVVDRRSLRARVYERGEGETLSSGTGSTAAAVAARLQGRTDDAISVTLRGGSLEISWDGRGEAFLEGPTVEVFTGEWQGGG